MEIPVEKNSGPAKWIAVGIGFAALAGLAIAAYRALSIADEHWIGIEEDYPEATPQPKADAKAISEAE